MISPPINEYFRAHLNPLPTNDAHVVSWTLHKLMVIYMGDLILGVILQYVVLLFLMVGKGLKQQNHVLSYNA